MNPPEVIRSGGLYRLHWPDPGVTVDVERIREHSDSVTAMVTVEVDLPGYERHIRAPFHLNLTSLPSRGRAAKEYTIDCPDIQWLPIFELTAANVLAMWRNGQPCVEMCMDASPPQWLLRPLLLRGLPTLLFGDGGTQKSYISLLVAVCLCLPWKGNPMKWWVPEKATKVLILDWETAAETVQWRLQRIARGHGLPATFPIEYRKCTQRFADDLGAIEKHVLDTEAEFVIVDSLGPACAGDLKDAETVTSFFNSLRELNVSSLLLTHVAKDELRKTKTPYGSVYFWNLARSAWEIRKVQDPGAHSMTIGLYHRKMNEAALEKPFGIDVTFDEEDSATIFSKADIREDADLAKGLTIKERVMIVLKQGALDVKDIAEQVEESEPKVRTTLNRYRNTFMKVGKQWGLKLVPQEEAHDQ